MLHSWESWLDSLFAKRIKNLLAKALYDNMAECPEELAFQKGDIVTVMEQNVAGSQGWWRCSLHGRQGLAPANRLYLLTTPQAETVSQGAVAHRLDVCSERWQTCNGTNQHIYQTPSMPRVSPSMPRASPSQTYEPMDRIYKVPSTPQAVCKPGHAATLRKHHTVDTEGTISLSKKAGEDGSRAEVYDVPTQPRGNLLLTIKQRSNNQLTSKEAMSVPSSEMKKKCEFENGGALRNRIQNYDPSYDIPATLMVESYQRTVNSGCSTMARPQKSEWIYDVPVTPEKSGKRKEYYGTMPSGAGQQINDRLQAQTLMEYDFPKPCPFPRQFVSPQSTYDTLPRPKRPEAAAYGSCLRTKCPPVTRQQPCDRTSPVHNPSEPELPQDKGEEPGRASLQTAVHAQQSSRVSSSSSSSRDSLEPSLSSEECEREVTLTQEEAARRLLELQETVCQAVPKLMAYVSSGWRSREHMARHIGEIRAAAEGIEHATARFLDFALDVRGNARHLSDANLQLRLHKQLSIVEDSGLILQQAVGVLAECGWKANALSQEPSQTQTLDQLDRFVMVARTMPEDVKRLVSILNANGKLLFRQTQKQPDAPADGKRSGKKYSESDSGAEDSDYVQLQTKTEFEKQQRMENNESKQAALNCSATAAPAPSPQQRGLSEHCRLYFGALQKAIRVFVESLVKGQPPESFINQGKLVIMVGQRLVDTLCREAHVQEAGAGQELLCKSNHLCALLKQLAVATKKAALHFPDIQTIQEAQDFAKELAQWAQHFRNTLDCRE